VLRSSENKLISVATNIAPLRAATLGAAVYVSVENRGGNPAMRRLRLLRDLSRSAAISPSGSRRRIARA
jgi:hypothetical protein